MSSLPTETIPIVILHHDEPDYLQQMLEAIRANTYTPYQLLVVDNHSVLPESLDLLAKIEKTDCIVIKNKSNRWVLGFNAALDHPHFNHKSSYYVFSDGDIIVPEPDEDGNCWLSRLISLMESTACAGKIGLSLDLKNLINRPDLKHIAEDEFFYLKGPPIGNLIVAPVDTTLAIYRPDVFVTKTLRFLPGHKSLLRPYYYSLRTNESFSAIHLGWNDYGKYRKQVSSKIRCFTKYGGYVDKSTLKISTAGDQIYYQIAGPICRLFWGLIVIYHWLHYVTKRFPRNLNELQARARKPPKSKISGSAK